MEKTRYDRTRMLVGEDGFARLRSGRVLIFGVGGVGGYAAEALARTGIGTIGLVDDDTVDVTNLNRQIIALESTLGLPKVNVMKDRIAGIDPETEVAAFHRRLTAETLEASIFPPGITSWMPSMTWQPRSFLRKKPYAWAFP